MAKKKEKVTLDTLFAPGVDAQEERERRAAADARPRMLQDALGYLDQAAETLSGAHGQIEACVRSALLKLEGMTIEDGETKEELIDKIRYLLRSSERRIECPKCREPALPFLIKNSAGGTIQLVHRGGAKGDTCSLLGEDRRWPALGLLVLTGDSAD